ncbi:actin-like ATPase domain-containing protein [Eremomyces bilateralis CBS 781.70]|uniref:Actin-like ATPase domain-containing protein n=1 Tax=Eremomyces bilateralis CBS 781.70 TaxID=1392243 RepID=A0A6G1G0Y3_9PEZI|nr:actin-like ATPase domain-containing protein [Eremomyces bilateralis CBS 781.70]KAF1811678.1 actin-like ATPase domain-containing protein [Eremomyces bilateralis CBS 781.70]
MARRSILPSLGAILCAILFFTQSVFAVSAVLGIDLGTEYIKAALVKPGIPLDIVLSKDSKRKEASAIAFKPARGTVPTEGSFPERLYGGDALSLAGRFPHDVYPNLKQLLGIPIHDDAGLASVVETYKGRYPALVLEAMEGRGTVGFKSKSFVEGAEAFSVEELLAMELMNVKENGQNMAGDQHRIDSVVITVPPFYTADEKRAVELAAELAGLDVMALTSDGLAVGMNYAMTREFPTVNEGGKPEYNMVYDMGAGHTTATILKFQGRTVKDIGRFNKTVQEVQVMGAGWDKSLGGDALNTLVVDDMVNKFLQSSEGKKLGVQASDVKAHGRAMAKLWKDAERHRQVLSANSDTAASFEELYGNVDFKYKISRSEFEKLASEFAQRLDGPAKQALEAAKLTMDDIDSIILHGGATRTPFVQKRLESLAGGASKLRGNVNADEAAVLGATFKGAQLSPSFRVKEIRDSDLAFYAAGLKWNDGKERQQKLFTPTSLAGFAKQVPLKLQTDFSFSLFQQVPTTDGSAVVDRTVSTVQTNNLTASVAELVSKYGCATENITTAFKVRIDSDHGIPTVVSGSVSCEVDDTKKGNLMEGVKDLFGFGKKKDGDQEVLEEETEPSSSTSSASEPETSSSSVSSSSASASPSAAAKPQGTKQKTVSINIDFTTTPAGIRSFSKEEMDRIHSRLRAFDRSDRDRFLRSELLNTLEAATYRTRDLLTEPPFIAASTSAIREQISSLLSTVSEWLYGDGADAVSDVIKARLDELNALVDPIKKRILEVTERPMKVRALQDALEQTQTMIERMDEEVASAVAAASKSAEEAASAASELLSSALSSSSADTETTAPASSSQSDDLDDLDDLSAAEWSTTTTPPSEPEPTEPVMPYTPEDISSLQKAHNEIKTWLNEKLALQETLSATDDPVLLTSELEEKTRHLQEELMTMLRRKMANFGGKKKGGGGKKGKKTSKAKGKKGKSTSTAKATAEKKPEESATEKTHDEL